MSWVSAPPIGLRAGGLVVLAALALAGCGAEAADEGAADGDAEPVGQELGGSVAHLAQCSDWVGASEAEKLATIEDVRSQVNREGGGVTASALTDAEAMEVFENGCDEAAAGSYRLHIMYARAAAFKPLREIAEGKE